MMSRDELENLVREMVREEIGKQEKRVSADFSVLTAEIEKIKDDVELLRHRVYGNQSRIDFLFNQ